MRTDSGSPGLRTGDRERQQEVPEEEVGDATVTLPKQTPVLPMQMQMQQALSGAEKMNWLKGLCRGVGVGTQDRMTRLE